MRRFVMTIGCGLVMFLTTAIASAQEKQSPEQAPYQKPIQAPTQKEGYDQAPTQKMAPTQAPTQKHMSPVQGPMQKAGQGPMQKAGQGAMQKPTQKPTQKGEGYSCGDCGRRRCRRC